MGVLYGASLLRSFSLCKVLHLPLDMETRSVREGYLHSLLGVLTNVVAGLCLQLQCKWCQSDIDVHVTRVNTYSTAAVFHIVCTVTIICTRMHTALASSLHSHPHCTRIHTALHSHPHCTALASALRISAPAHPPQPPFHASPCCTRHLPRAGIELVVVDDERMPSTSDGHGDYS